jgi:hypothetical protein
LADEVILMINHKTEIPGQVGKLAQLGIGCLDVVWRGSTLMMIAIVSVGFFDQWGALHLLTKFQDQM